MGVSSYPLTLLKDDPPRFHSSLRFVSFVENTVSVRIAQFVVAHGDTNAFVTISSVSAPAKSEFLNLFSQLGFLGFGNWAAVGSVDDYRVDTPTSGI